MPNTGMVARDVLAFASGLPSFYNALYGTPAADVVIKLGESLTNAMTYTVEDEPEDEQDFIDKCNEFTELATKYSQDAVKYTADAEKYKLDAQKFAEAAQKFVEDVAQL